MNLYLTDTSFLNTEYKDSNGKTLYKVSTPPSLGHQTMTITRLIDSESESETESEDVLKGRFIHLARIEFKAAAPSVIHYKGTELDTKEVFKKGEWGHFGRNRVFTASDGKEYKWILGPTASSLILNNSTKQHIARFHPKEWFPKKPAHLEIDPGVGMDMIDEIFVSFLYIEKIRRDMEGSGNGYNR